MKKYKCLTSDYGYFTQGKIYQEDFIPLLNHHSIKDYVKLYPNEWEEIPESLDLTKILKGCEGQTFYCTILGEVTLITTNKRSGRYPIIVTSDKTSTEVLLTKEGLYLVDEDTSECILFPSKENRDWSTFKPKIPFGTPVMVSNNGTHWKLKKYNEILRNTYIVPVDKFDFSNFEANK